MTFLYQTLIFRMAKELGIYSNDGTPCGEIAKDVRGYLSITAWGLYVTAV